MRKRNEFDEFRRLLEEAIDGMIDEMNLPEDKPVNIEMETIKLTGSGKVLEITALSGDNAIDERIELPARVNKTFKATYKDGILEVVFNKPKKARRAIRGQQSF